MKVTVMTTKPFNEIGVVDLAAFYKYCGLDKYIAWDQYIKDRGLRPEMNAKDFYSIFTGVSPAPLPIVSRDVEFTPTHMDTYTGHLVMIVGDGPWELIWDTGYHGHNPVMYPPDAERFILLNEEE